MAFRCFKKLIPQNPVRLTGNVAIKFKTYDNVFGYYATQDANIQAQLEGLVRAGEYGMTEIPETEFRDFLEKKSRPSSPVWREEFSPGKASRLLAESEAMALAAQGAAVNAAPKPSPAVVATVTTPLMADPASVPNKPPVTPEFNPPVGRRRASSRRKPTPPAI